MSERDLALPGWRTLHVYDEGDPAGRAVVVHNGTPSSGLLHGPHAADAAARGLRLIGYDRAGYGGSDPDPGRSVASVAADVAAVLDALGIERFATWGISGGGPHALACAALLPERCAAAAALASPAPYGAVGLDWLAGMGEGNVAEFEAALAGPEALEPLLAQEAGLLAAADAPGFEESLSTLLSPPDRAALAGPLGGYLREAMGRAVRQGVEGWRDDDLAFARPWGFDPAEIRVPVLLLQGEQDLMVPPAHGRWLAAQVPQAEAEIAAADGHVTLYRRIPEVHAWLSARL